MDTENYQLPKETSKVNLLIQNFHFFMIYADMKNKDHIETFFEFAEEFEKEIRNSDGMRSIEFLDKVSQIEKFLQKFENDKILDFKVKYPDMKNTFSSYCSLFKINYEEPYENERDFEEAMFDLRFGIGEIPEL